MDVQINIGDKTKIEGTSNIHQQKAEIKVLYYNITEFSQYNQILICSVGVFFFYLLYGYLQELIFTIKIDGFEAYGWYLTLVQFAFYILFGFMELNFQGKIRQRKTPIKVYSFLALLTLGTMGFSNSSLSYLNYPTQVIFKSCKLIPVMIGSILIQQKKYSFLDYAAAILMSVGLTLFTLADSRVSPKFNFVGVLMISCALLCDAIIGNVQEKVLKLYSPSNTEIVLYSYALGFVYLLVIMLMTGSVWTGVLYVPQVFYFYALLFSLSGYLGIQIVLTLLRVCGALGTVTITTCRKAVTIILSFMFFSKPFTFQYVWSGLLIVLAIYLNVLSKSNKEFVLQLQNIPRHITNLLRPKFKEKHLLDTV